MAQEKESSSSTNSDEASTQITHAQRDWKSLLQNLYTHTVVQSQSRASFFSQNYRKYKFENNEQMKQCVIKFETKHYQIFNKRNSKPNDDNYLE
eukprot:890388_1